MTWNSNTSWSLLQSQARGLLPSVLMAPCPPTWTGSRIVCEGPGQVCEKVSALQQQTSGFSPSYTIYLFILCFFSSAKLHIVPTRGTTH